MPKQPPEDAEDSAAFERQLAHLACPPVRLPPATTARVMARIRAEPDGVFSRLAAWWLRPAALRASPLALSGLAALLMIVAGIAGSRVGRPSAAPSPATRFVLIAPGAHTISVTGDFRGWDPAGIALHDENGTGVWTVDVPLPPGMHRYQFVVDGAEWVADPNALLWEDDGFGRRNSVLLVTAPSRS